MRAAYYVGDHSFSVETVAPVALGDDEFRVNVAYCGICGTDMHVYHGAMNARVGDHRMLGARVYEAEDYEQAIAPGYIQTDNTQALQDDAQRSASIVERIPAKRWGEPKDFAGAAVFLASAASDYMHGAILTIDGGWMGR